MGRGSGCGEVREDSEWKAGDGIGRGSPYLPPPLFLPISQGICHYRSISPSFAPFLSSLLLPFSLLLIILMEGGKDSETEEEGGRGREMAVHGGDGGRAASEGGREGRESGRAEEKGGKGGREGRGREGEREEREERRRKGERDSHRE